MTPTTVQRIGAFAVDARTEDLDPQARTLLKRNVLDSVGCALGALPGRPFGELRQHFARFGGATGACILIGGGSAPPD